MRIHFIENDFYFFLTFSFSLVKISSVGSFNIFLFAIFFSSERSSAGSNSKLDAMANNKVTDTKPPKAMVPPKLETVNTKNPKNNTIDV